jgi:hypothetical protein
VHRDAAVGLPHLGNEAARLDRMRRAAMLPELLFEHMGGLGEGRAHVTELDLVGGDDVGRQLAADRRGILRRPHVGDERQCLVIHRDQRGGVLGDVAVVRQHHRHRLADVAGLARRERKGPGLVERHAGVGVAHHAALDHRRREIVEGEHRVHAGHRQRGGLVHAFDQRMRMRAPHEGRLRHAGEGDVVDEAPPSAQQRLVLQAGDAGADDGHRQKLRVSCPANAGHPGRRSVAER